VEPHRPSARSSLIRTALLYTPLFILLRGALGFVIRELALEPGAGSVAAVVIVGLLAFLTGYQSVQALRDLVAQPMETQGVIHRKWRRNDLFVMHSHYLLVNRHVFRVEPTDFMELEVDDTVSIVHYPHTDTVESLALLERQSRREDGRP
jgi:hypothetical protein